MSEAKTVVMELACRLSGMTQREIGRRYGGVSSQAVTMARKRAAGLVDAGELERWMGLIRGPC